MVVKIINIEKSRVAAASNAMFLSKIEKPLQKLLAIDPACPLYEEGE